MAVRNKATCCTLAFSCWTLVLVMLVQRAGARPNRKEQEPVIKLPTQLHAELEEGGTRWAVLVAGSNGFGNYRHQVS